MTDVMTSVRKPPRRPHPSSRGNERIRYGCLGLWENHSFNGQYRYRAVKEGTPIPQKLGIHEKTEEAVKRACDTCCPAGGNFNGNEVDGAQTRTFHVRDLLVESGLHADCARARARDTRTSPLSPPCYVR